MNGKVSKDVDYLSAMDEAKLQLASRISNERTITTSLALFLAAAVSALSVADGMQDNPVYVDDVYCGRGKCMESAFLDIERIEVIKGPGGTLWGANAVNGVINIITKNLSQISNLRISKFKIMISNIALFKHVKREMTEYNEHILPISNNTVFRY